MTTSFVERNLQRLKNVREYCREIGLPGTISLVRQKVAHVPVFELKVRGIDTPVFCRAQGSDFAVLRQVLGHQDAAIQFDHPPKLIIDAGANVGYSSLVFMSNYPSATIVAVEPDKTNCACFARTVRRIPVFACWKGRFGRARRRLPSRTPRPIRGHFK